MRKLLKSTKASTVVATIILIAATVAVSIAVAAWVTSLTFSFIPQIEEDAGLSPSSLLTRARALLEEASCLTEEKKILDKLDKAIEHIEKSLDLDLWVDDCHLDPNIGKKVFDEEKKAVKKLMDLIKKGDTPQNVKDKCQEVIEKLVDAGKILAETIYEEAQNGAGNDKELEKCEKELNKAEEELKKEHYDKAIDHYKKAWEHAQKALT